MDWIEANLSLQLATEFQFGAARRLAAYQRRAEEDAAWDTFKARIGNAG